LTHKNWHFLPEPKEAFNFLFKWNQLTWGSSKVLICFSCIL